MIYNKIIKIHSFGDHPFSQKSEIWNQCMFQPGLPLQNFPIAILPEEVDWYQFSICCGCYFIIVLEYNAVLSKSTSPYLGKIIKQKQYIFI